MPQYHLDKFFVPDDKNIYDMLHSCGTNAEKIWEYAHGFDIITSASTDDIQNLRSYVARLQVDHGKLRKLFDLINSQDREEQYSSEVVDDNPPMDRIEAVAREVQAERTTSHHEKFSITQSTGDSLEMAINYIEPDFSKTEALQIREKQAKVVIEKSGNKFVIRHHSNPKAVEIAKAVLDKLMVDPSAKDKVRTYDFTAIKDTKLRTKFFRDLAYGIPKFKLRDVPSLKVHRLESNDEDSDGDDESKEAIEAGVRKIFLSGSDIIHSPEYVELEKRGFFISSMTWVSEIEDDNGEHYEFTAAFPDPESPTNIRYAATGKFLKDSDGNLREHKTKLSSPERLSLMRKLEHQAQKIYQAIAEEKEGGNNGNQDPLAP